MNKQADRRLMTLYQRQQFMFELGKIVRETGEFVQSLGKDDILTTFEVDRHTFSHIDARASNDFRGRITSSSILDGLGTYLEESEITRALIDRGEIKFPILLVDTVEGSTNARRGLAAHFRRPILAGVSAVALENEKLSSVAASAFYDFASNRTFTSIRGDHGSFLSFADNQLINPVHVLEVVGDNTPYVVVPNYSNSYVDKRAQVEQALVSEGFVTHGGTRSSAQDLLEMLSNQVDAYVDLRALFTNTAHSRDETLHFWDVGGLLPVLDGLGFMIANASNFKKCTTWQACSCWDDLALLVARPSIGAKIREIIRGLPFVEKQPDDANIVRMNSVS